MTIPEFSLIHTVMYSQSTTLSSRPERTRIPYFTAPNSGTYATLRKERRTGFTMQLTVDRESGGAEWRDLRSAQACPNACCTP
jgi:hypothetical protein